MNKKIFRLILCISGLTLQLHATKRKTVQGADVTCPTEMSFEKNVFYSGTDAGDPPVMFLGEVTGINPLTTKASSDRQFTLSRLILENPVTDSAAAKIESLTPEVITLNGQAPLEGGTDNNPLRGTFEKTTRVSQIALFNKKFPVVARDTMQEGDESPTTQIILVTDPKQGLTLLSLDEIKDAAGEIVSSGIAALAGSDKYIFAAVPATGKTFGGVDGVDRGIAVVRQPVSPDEQDQVVTTELLEQLDATDFLSGNAQAALLDVSAEKELVAFSDPSENGNNIEKALIGDNASLWWDEHLQRLYIGLTDVCRDDPTKGGGGLSVVMGDISKPTDCDSLALTLLPIVRDPRKELFFGATENQRNTLDHVVGFYFNGLEETEGGAINKGTNEVCVSTELLRTMQTTTCKNYLLVNSSSMNQPIVANDHMITPADDGVFAVPLIPEVLNGELETKGTIAKVDSTSGVAVLDDGAYDIPRSFEDMPRTYQPAIAVGGSRPVESMWLTDFFTQGDTVFMTLDGPNDTSEGIFKSTALLNKDGLIVGWTPATRVMGSAQQVMSAGLDPKTGNFYFVSNDPLQDPFQPLLFNTGQITCWGKGDRLLHGDDEEKMLSSVLEDIFPPSLAGVHQLYPFNELTPGFFKGCFAMMVAVGRDRIALAQTGMCVNTQFRPVSEFVLNENVFVLGSDRDAQDIKPFTCAAVVKNGDEGRLWVGGFDGVVMSQSWPVPALGGLSFLSNNEDEFPGPTHTFTSLDISGPVLKIEANATHVFVLTYDKVYRRNLDGMPPADNNELNVILASDMVVAGNRIIVSSAVGIQFSHEDFSALQMVNDVPGYGLQLQYLSDLDENCFPKRPGNVYALVLGEHVNEVDDSDPCPSDCDECNRCNDCSACRTCITPCKPVCNRCPEPDPEIVLQVYRLAVSDDEISVIDKNKIDHTTPAPFLQFNDRRSHIATDGAIILNTHSREECDIDFLRSLPVLCNTMTSTEMLTHERMLTDDLDVDFCLHRNICTPKRDDASGAWIVPGDWGVRVNE